MNTILTADELDESLQFHEFPSLYALSSTGKVKTWKISVYKNQDGTATTQTQHGYLDGVLQTKIDITRTGKNIGRANETTPFEQSYAEAQSAWNRKTDKKYGIAIPGVATELSSTILLPMLAHDYRKRGHDIDFPCYVQPKLNGVRALAHKVSNNNIQFTSRKYKPFPEGVTAHLVAPLINLMEKGEIWDGEFYVHGWPFQEIVRLAKKARPNAHELEYHVFDIADSRIAYSERYRRLRQAAEKRDSKPVVNRPVRFVECLTINEVGSIRFYYDLYFKGGFEGIILRNINSLYLFDHRSKDLQKLKEFVDKEFTIVGGEAEVITDPVTRQDSKAVVFTCAIEDGQTFNVRPRGTVAQRVKWFNELDSIVGKQLTVRYQELSTSGNNGPGGIPIFPVGVAIRDYE